MEKRKQLLDLFLNYFNIKEVAKLAKKKLSNKIVKELLERYDNGETPADLAISYGVHATTIRRYLRKNGRKLLKISHPTEISYPVKLELRKILIKYNVNNIEDIISELDKKFIIELKKEDKDDAFNIIFLE